MILLRQNTVQASQIMKWHFAMGNFTKFYSSPLNDKVFAQLEALYSSDEQKHEVFEMGHNDSERCCTPSFEE